MSLIINNKNCASLVDPATPLLDFLRHEAGLTAAKPGCGTGDCGSCLVLVGEFSPADAAVKYRALNSCLLTVGQAEGCQVITPEGLAGATLTPVQQALADQGAIQCGYCTPGLVIALTAALLNGRDLMEAAAGNLCRCTGYGGIRRACEALAAQFEQRPRTLDEIVANGLIPADVAAAAAQLQPLPVAQLFEQPVGDADSGLQYLGGGTDWMVNRPRDIELKTRCALHRVPSLRRIVADDEYLCLGAAVTIDELQHSPAVASDWPLLAHYLERFGSPSVRAMATAGGNLVNASPVADLAVLLLVMEAEVELSSADSRRWLPLPYFFRAYHQTELKAHEVLTQIRLPRNPSASVRLHFEKIAKRELDDIATVNTALSAAPGKPGRFGRIRLSAGGVAPVPRLLHGVSDYLSGREVNTATVREALARVDADIAPVDDARGSAAYKRRLLKHLLVAHLTALYPELSLREYLA
ncbi:MAG TPA: FAD binding domain-containing protein [Fluviicoccus sp.]|nr:FAD binding domain-containing protein [Fluviicoccus sp.]